MAFAHLLKVALAGISVASGLTLDTTLLKTLSNGSSSLPMRHLNLTSRLSNMEFICNGDIFGRGLALDSCSDPIRQMNYYSQIQRTWGPRGTGAFDIDLPLRYISVDGLCYIEPQLIGGVDFARASEQETAGAAFVIFNKCVLGGANPEGGIARAIGGDNSLAIAVSAFEPDVQCYETIDPPSLLASCQSIVNTMNTSTIPLTFRVDGANDAAIGLPYIFESEDKRCVMIIMIIDGLDTYTWRKFWEVAVALTGMCARTDRKGIRTGLGDNGRLLMKLEPSANEDIATSSKTGNLSQS